MEKYDNFATDRRRPRLRNGVLPIFAPNASRVQELRNTLDSLEQRTEARTAELLEIALDDLIGNAWKFTRHTPQPCVEFGCRTEDGKTILFVRDNGCGFDMTYSDKLFEPFQRLHTDD